MAFMAQVPADGRAGCGVEGSEVGVADASSAYHPAPQVGARKVVYAPIRNPRTGRTIYPGLSVGSEAGWGELPQPFSIAESHFKYVVFGSPDRDFRTFDLDRDLAKAASPAR
jgi:hypothetical protein